MKISIIATLAAITLATGIAATPATAAVDNAFASFNGTQGAGNFFYGNVVSGVFTMATACGPIDFPLTACLGSASYPYFGTATSAGPHSGALLPIDRLLTHTSLSSLGLIGWRAPAAGDYSIDGLFSLHHPTRQLGNGIGVTGVFQQLGQPGQITPRFVLNQAEQAVTLSRNFAVGDVYFFVLDANGSNAYDLGGVNMIATSLSSPGVPEPTTWAMFVAGFGVVGAVTRRRQKALAVTA